MKPLAALPLALAIVVGLSGCITVQLPQSGNQGNDRDDSTAQPGSDLRCDDELLLNTPGDYAIQGDCELLTLEGADITVSANNVDSLVVRGDRASVSADDIDDIDIAGNDNAVALTDSDRVSIAGDRNEITGGDLDSVTVQGNDNTLTARDVESFNDSGDRNTVTPN